MNKKTVSFKCPPIVERMLDELEKLDNDNRSQVILQAIREYYVKRINQKYTQTGMQK